MRTLVVGTLAATLGEKPQSDDIRDRPNLATKKAKSALAAAKVEVIQSQFCAYKS